MPERRVVLANEGAAEPGTRFNRLGMVSIDDAKLAQGSYKSSPEPQQQEMPLRSPDHSQFVCQNVPQKDKPPHHCASVTTREDHYQCEAASADAEAASAEAGGTAAGAPQLGVSPQRSQCEKHRW